MKFCVFTLGCKVNQYESIDIISALKKQGFEATEDFSYADIYIINTCSITAVADKKSRQTVARALSKNPDAKIIILGCSSENSPNAYKEKDSVIAVLGTADKTQAVLNVVKTLQNQQKSEDLLANETNEPQQKNEDLLANEASENLLAIDEVNENTRSRAYLKIQDGCNNFCSYCIVPYLRGRSKSRPIDQLVEEAKNLARLTKEIVITGINISAFCHEGNDLGCLIEALKEVPARKRLSSLECNIITRELLQKMKDANFCDHFHLSLQSGSSSVLKDMNRHYTPSEFLDKVRLIGEYFPYAGITTDIIAAFPTETDQHHRETLDFLKRVQFSDIHIFPYSRREGTKAADLPLIDGNIVKQRVAELTTLKEQLKLDFYNKNLARELKVYIEDSEGEYNVGYTSNYIKVYSKAPCHSYHTHKLVKSHGQNGMIGEIL